MYQEISGGITAALGFKAGGIHCGIRHNASKQDLAMVLCDNECSAAAVYTQNKVKGAPLLVTKDHIRNGKAWGVLCNSGNANTCNPDGIEIANACCQLAAEATGLSAQNFAVASTGVIGQPLSLTPFESGIPKLVDSLSKDGSNLAAKAIMTTDTHPKEYAVEFSLQGKPCRIGIIGKGSGMINPNMATMLVFITTDVAITPSALEAALKHQTIETFNQISVDGDTSTNDMALILASGQAGNQVINNPDCPGYQTFCDALHQACRWMSRCLAADGEGATKLLECVVSGAPDNTIAKAIAKSVVSSDLLKTAMFGQDANWGRVLCAVGYTPGSFSPDNISLVLQSSSGSVEVCRHSAYYEFSEQLAAEVLQQKEIQILIDLNNGTGQGTAWGCDLTYDYIKINGDYRT